MTSGSTLQSQLRVLASDLAMRAGALIVEGRRTGAGPSSCTTRAAATSARRRGAEVILVPGRRGRVPFTAVARALAARGLGVKMPVYPIKGYSVTIPTTGFDGAPTIPGVDEGNLIAFCRMGDKLRLTATADFAGYDTGYEAKDFAPMLRVAREHGLDCAGVNVDAVEDHHVVRSTVDDEGARRR